MRMVLSQQGWIFDGLTELEWLFLQRLPILVDELGADEDARLRLFPDPVREKEEEAREGSGTDDDKESENLIGDWNKYVRPELETMFDEARHRVVKDLEKAQQFEVEVETGGELGGQVFYSLEVSSEHVEQWHSTLNQARLLMNEVHELAESERQLAEGVMDLPGVDEGLDGEEGLSRQAKAYPKWLLLAQYGFYGAVQSFLIEYLMEV
jgi:hypothetical protein